MVNKLRRALARHGAFQTLRLTATMMTEPFLRPLRKAEGRRRARQLLNAGPLRLAVGAGPHRRPGWVNTDIGAGADLYLDITEPLPFPEASVECIHAEHVIEHIPKPAAYRFLQESARVLTEDGWLRLVTPDLGAVSRAYVGDIAQLGQAATRAAVHVSEFAASEYGSNGMTAVDYINYLFTAHRHRYLYDFSTLQDMLRAAGLGNVRRAPYADSEVPELRGLELHYSAEDVPLMAPFTLIVEAQRQKET